MSEHHDEPDERWKAAEKAQRRMTLQGQVLGLVFAGTFLVAIEMFGAPPVLSAMIIGGVYMTATFGVVALSANQTGSRQPSTRDWLVFVLTGVAFIGLLELGGAIWLVGHDIGLAIVPFFGAAGIGVVWCIVWAVRQSMRDARDASERR